MNFKEYIEKKDVYKKLTNYAHGVIKKYNIEQCEREEVISSVFEALSAKNPAIEGDVNGFKKGTFAKYCDYKTMNYFKNKHKKRLLYPEFKDFKLFLRDLKEDEYSEPDFLDVNKIKNTTLRKIAKDKLDNKLTFKQLEQKYGLARQVILDRIKRDLMRKTIFEYKGVAKIVNGKIEKCYPDIKSTEKDGYSIEGVRMCCKGMIGSHKGVKFKFIKDIKNGK